MSDRGAKFFGESCGKHGTYTFYPGLEYNASGRSYHLMLGNFFNISIKSPHESGGSLDLIGELQLVWHDKNHDGEKLSSVKLYARPEDCPGGRQPHHGQDEILAEETKVVIRLSHLVELVISSSQCSSHRNHAVQSTHHSQEKCIKVQRPLITSYPQYCRYKAALKRLESVDHKFHNEALTYLLGKNFMQNFCDEDRDVYFCRDNAVLPDLKHFRDELSHLAPRLKGRKRKKKQSPKLFDSDDSNESEVCLDHHIILRKNHRATASIDFALMNGRSLPCKRRKVSTEEDLTRNKESFMKMLFQFMKENHSPISRSPTLGFKEVDLHQFYISTKKRGGYKEVTKKKLWKEIYDELGGSSCNTSAATGTRKNYEKFLQPFENFLNGTESRSTHKKCYKTKKSLSIGKVPENNSMKPPQVPNLAAPHKPKTNVETLVIKPPTDKASATDKAAPSSEPSMTKYNDNLIPIPCKAENHPKSEAHIFQSPVTCLSPVSNKRESIPNSTLSSSSNLSTMSQKLLAGGLALLNIKNEIIDQKPIGPINHLLVPRSRPWKNIFTSPSVFAKDLLSSVLPSSPSNLPMSHYGTGFHGNNSIKAVMSSKSRFEINVEDLCVRTKRSSSSFAKGVKTDFEQVDDVPLDYSMKTLKNFEVSSLKCKGEEPLDLSIKKENVKGGLSVENVHLKCCDSQAPLDLSKSSSVYRKLQEERQNASLPINLAQLLPLAFAMPLSSTFQVLPQVMSPIQQNINMIYNPGSVNFPILSFAPPSTEVLSSLSSSSR